MERMQELRRKIIGASIYPILVMSIALLVVLCIMTFIVPTPMDASRVGASGAV